LSPKKQEWERGGGKEAPKRERVAPGYSRVGLERVRKPRQKGGHGQAGGGGSVGLTGRTRTDP